MLVSSASPRLPAAYVAARAVVPTITPFALEMVDITHPGSVSQDPASALVLSDLVPASVSSELVPAPFSHLVHHSSSRESHLDFLPAFTWPLQWLLELCGLLSLDFAFLPPELYMTCSVLKCIFLGGGGCLGGDILSGFRFCLVVVDCLLGSGFLFSCLFVLLFFR